MSIEPKRADVAKAAGVSESTVSRALTDSPLISSPVKDRVRETASRLGYIPSRQAALFARNKTLTLGFVVTSYSAFPPFSRPYFPTLLDGVVIGADELGYSITIVLNKVGGRANDHFSLVRSRAVDGLLFSVTPADYEPFLDLTEQKIPFVLINNYHEGLSSVDNLPEPGMRMAFSHASNLGHRRIGYITGDMNFRNAIDRYEAFERLAEEFCLSPVTVEGNFSKTSGYLGAGRLLESADAPTLIMTSSDRAALGVLQYCFENGLNVPRDVSVIGYDNLFPVQDIVPKLSTVENPIRQSGLLAARLLIDLIEGKRKGPVAEWLDTGFVVRESTAAARTGR
jgi:LacI family transcriptional regulator